MDDKLPKLASCKAEARELGGLQESTTLVHTHPYRLVAGSTMFWIGVLAASTAAAIR